MRAVRLRREVRAAVTRVLGSPRRLRYLFGHGVHDATTLVRFLSQVVPLAYRQLEAIGTVATTIPDPQLAAIAASTLDRKAFHVAGACVLATFLPPGAREHYVEIVAPLESIYDYLDSVTDRHPATSIDAVDALHDALRDALDPQRPLGDYYRAGPPGDDGGYLATLVQRTRAALLRLAEYEVLLPHFREAAQRYADHQRLKHLPRERRAQAIAAWADMARDRGGLHWWEYAAACGSQFHVYAPLYAALCSDLPQAEHAYHAYFPAFCALHVLFDAFLDREEDAAHGELNWLSLYDDPTHFIARARQLARAAEREFHALAEPRYHAFALRVMTLFYLTHPRVFATARDGEANALLRALA